MLGCFMECKGTDALCGRNICLPAELLVRRSACMPACLSICELVPTSKRVDQLLWILTLEIVSNNRQLIPIFIYVDYNRP